MRGFGGAHRDEGKDDLRALQAAGRVGNDIAVVQLDSAPIASSAFRCSSTGRAPMAQPPGSDTLASPMRASSGPSTWKLARILRTMS